MSDNCYQWDAEVNLCNLSKVEEASLWHKRLEHISGTTLSKVTKADAIIGLPTLTFTSLESCSESLAGKQVKSPHKSAILHSTSRTLELIHIDLMRPMQAETLGGKRVILRPRTTTTSYELWKGRKLNVKYFHIFGSTCFIMSDRDHRQKWDSKSDRGIFLGYSTNSRAYRVFNQCTKTVMESMNVIIDDLEKGPKRSLDEEDGDF
ncbi:putative gag-pol polyprotein [Cucumis melo var. makuwa]|uniref:Gag-pol polyprotein n=1 Tax=Cucumis melo var. makuwa TaxID=1194695 RepID=A0A5A7TPJ0_CUCMM|nr:putative gag-pol polyprotein [Cucumis melo var. makuwa]TYK23925.1 putative gag-pol polyprotein [Cucumis melo var. makuwa]